MKIYLIMGNCFRPSDGIHSAYVTEEKAKAKAHQMQKELYEFKLGSYMSTHDMTKEEAIKCVRFPDWLYPVKELEAEE